MPRLNETFPNICHEWHKKVSNQDFKFDKGCHSQCLSHFYVILGVFRVVLVQPYMRQKVVGAYNEVFSICGGRVASFSGFSGCVRSFYFYEEDRDERGLNGRLHSLCFPATCFVSPICRHQVKKDHPKDQ